MEKPFQSLAGLFTVLWQPCIPRLGASSANARSWDPRRALLTMAVFFNAARPIWSHYYYRQDLGPWVTQKHPQAACCPTYYESTDADQARGIAA